MNTKKRYTRISKFLSLVLRHRPQKIGIQLDEQGWVDMPVLLDALKRSKLNTDREELLAMVAANDKQRFSYDATEDRIRASQGHSIKVELGYTAQEPPAILFHGTVNQFITSIRERGLLPQKRHHVHLSPDTETATNVGKRRGEPIILSVDAARMAQDGCVFFKSENGVWLTDHVPPHYIEFPI